MRPYYCGLPTNTYRYRPCCTGAARHDLCRPRHQGTPMACVHDVLRAEHLHEWLGLSGLSRYAVATHAVTSSLSIGRHPPVAAGPSVRRAHDGTAAVRRVTRPADDTAALALPAPPPSASCPFGCGVADNTSHLLSGCTQYTAAYIARHDRVVRRIGAMLQKRTPRRRTTWTSSRLSIWPRPYQRGCPPS